MDLKSAKRHGFAERKLAAAGNSIHVDYVQRLSQSRRRIGMAEMFSEEFYDPNVVDPSAEPTGTLDTDVEGLGPAASEEEKTAEQSLRRLQQYINTSLTEQDPEAAMLGVANGMLMKMLLRLEGSIDSVLATCPAGSEHLAVVMRGIEVALRLTLQMSRFTQLRLLLKNAHGATARLRKG